MMYVKHLVRLSIVEHIQLPAHVLLFLGIGCPNGKTVSDGGNKTKGDVQLTNWTDPNLPFSPFDEKYTNGPAAVSNITIQSGEVGNECIHRHRLAFDSDTPHTFEMKTRACYC